MTVTDDKVSSLRPAHLRVSQMNDETLDSHTA